MCHYTAMAVLNIHKQWWQLQAQQEQGVWAEPVPEVIPLKIGVLGMGELGVPVAKTLQYLGFEVLGYSRTAKTVEGIPIFSEGELSVAAFAEKVNTLVCVLPLTPQTEGVLNRDVFSAMPRGSYIINIARGGHIVDADLLDALDTGKVERAVLDVFHTEPLPAAHPFWAHPRVTLTPHIASVTNQANAAAIVAENYLRAVAGQELKFPVDAKVGY
jgi:glyoxylate/hydroxypyruvate reductase A